jgi:hypothetical protein
MDGEGLLSVGSWRETALCTSRGRNIIMRKMRKMRKIKARITTVINLQSSCVLLSAVIM